MTVPKPEAGSFQNAVLQALLPEGPFIDNTATTARYNREVMFESLILIWSLKVPTKRAFLFGTIV